MSAFLPKTSTLLLIASLCGFGSAHATIDPTGRALALSEALNDTALKQRLQSCATQDFYPTEFSIAHRGAPLGYPEHSREGYIAAAEQGAGVIECDVTFTKDLELVCRHSQCDLATTTNILQTPLAAKCSSPFRPAGKSNRQARPAAHRISRWRNLKHCAPDPTAATRQHKPCRNFCCHLTPP